MVNSIVAPGVQCDEGVAEKSLPGAAKDAKIGLASPGNDVIFQLVMLGALGGGGDRRLEAAHEPTDRRA